MPACWSRAPARASPRGTIESPPPPRLPALAGPVTFQARGTLVSLVSPRRTFALLKPTTKSRVDLGLRLDTTQPGGLLPARDLGQATVRIALTNPGEVDDEVQAWLTKADDENTAPPAGKPRPPARPKPVLGTLSIVIEGSELPGLTCQPEPDGTVHRNIHVALSTTAKGIAEGQSRLTVPRKPGLAADPLPGDAKQTRWEVTVTVRGSAAGGYDFTGPCVGGDRTDRHLGLVWETCPATARCSCSAAPNSVLSTCRPASSLMPCVPGIALSPGCA